jgi:hypothetical protein
MACSKLFSGDLPELINEIIQYFHNDYKTLHSCVLVNRLWCRLAIPLLWEDPFSIKFPKSYHFIEIYLHNLNENDKAKLNDYAILNDIFPSNTLFNYPSFIKHLDTFEVCKSVEKWVAIVETSANKAQHFNHFIQISNLSPLQLPNLTKLIYKSLFLIFIENKVNLHSFDVILNTQNDVKCFDETFELILQNPNFINNMKNFKFDLDAISDNITEFLGFINSNCKSISSLYFLFPTYYDNYLIIEKSLSQIINSQENLNKVLFGYSDFPLYQLFLSLKYPNCLNTLSTIIFYYIDFEDVVTFSEVFNQLNALESIHIVYCYSLDSKFVQQINNITKPFKLKSLFLHGVLRIELLETLMQKSGNYLENFGINRSESQQILQLIIKYCNKIKYLGPIKLDTKNIIYILFNLIESITQNLNYLIIHADYYNFSSILLQNLGQVLPFKIEYLRLGLKVNNTSDLKVFLENSQNTFIKKLIIKNEKSSENEDIFPYIKEYIMKKKKVKYLAILETFHGKSEDLFSLKDKVQEFQLHDIQVLKYNDSIIDIYDFINEIY